MRTAFATRNYKHVLNEKIQTELRIKAYQNPAFEVCGFITESGLILDVENVSSDPKNSFFMSPNEQYELMRRHNGHILGIWHTHPSGIPYPSEHDEQGVLYGMSSEWWYWIVTTEHVYQYSWAITEQDSGVPAL